MAGFNVDMGLDIGEDVGEVDVEDEEGDQLYHLLDAQNAAEQRLDNQIPDNGNNNNNIGLDALTRPVPLKSGAWAFFGREGQGAKCTTAHCANML